MFTTTNNDFVIVDWKLTSAPVDTSRGKLRGSLQHLPDSSMTMYTLQLNTYCAMLMEWMKKKKSNIQMFVVVVDGDELDVRIVPELANEMSLIREERKKSLAATEEVKQQLRYHLGGTAAGTSTCFAVWQSHLRRVSHRPLQRQRLCR